MSVLTGPREDDVLVVCVDAVSACQRRRVAVHRVRGLVQLVQLFYTGWGLYADVNVNGRKGELVNVCGDMFVSHLHRKYIVILLNHNKISRYTVAQYVGYIDLTSNGNVTDKISPILWNLV